MKNFYICSCNEVYQYKLNQIGLFKEPVFNIWGQKEAIEICTCGKNLKNEYYKRKQVREKLNIKNEESI